MPYRTSGYQDQNIKWGATSQEVVRQQCEHSGSLSPSVYALSDRPPSYTASTIMLHIAQGEGE